MRIAERFDGPPGSANGGVTAGRLAAYVGAADGVLPALSSAIWLTVPAPAGAPA